MTTATKTDFETVIGLEVHVQLLTKSKMFCRCSAAYADAPPNTHVCPVCLGMPGVLPSINRQAVDFTLMTALALNCTISEHTKFDRKNYPYPDLVKGYQISQYDMPFSKNGWLEIEVGGKTRRIGITRVHLEEDVGKLLHRSDSEAYSLIDFNRSGVPLMEIVSEPDMRSPEEARQYLQALHSILRYIGVSTANMEEGSFRCDANVSIKPVGSDKLMPKAEVKNMNSFKAVFQALEYEEKRQRDLAARGERLVQETRGWVEEKEKTVSQRSKEYAHDYRYFPEPDLPPMAISSDWVARLEASLPELPAARHDRFIQEYGLSHYDATLLTDSKVIADYFESYMRLEPHKSSPEKAKTAKEIANWVLGEFSRLLKVTNTEINQSKITAEKLKLFIDLKEQGVISGPAAKTVFEEMFNTGKDAQIIIREKGLSQISDTSAIEEEIRKIIAQKAQAVADYKAGKEQALKFLVGQIMRATKGRANPQMAAELLKKNLEGK